MAMIKCPDCKSPVSDTADCCPRCGCKFRSEYQEMLNLRREIPQLEGLREGAPEWEWNAGLVAVSLIGLLLFVVGIVATKAEYGSSVTAFFALFGIFVGGGLCWFGVYSLYDSYNVARSTNWERNRDVRERKASLEWKKRRLADLEAKFR